MQVEARSSDDYIFSVLADDGVRLIIAGQTVVDDWAASGLTWHDAAPLNT